MTLFQPSKPTIVYNADGEQVTLSPDKATQFDKSTLKKSKEFGILREGTRMASVQGFESGRYSARMSLRIMAKAMVKILHGKHTGNIVEDVDEVLWDAVNRVKANGDWCLEEE